MPMEISIVTGGAVPIYRQIADQICRAVATGQLSAGEQVPSVRVLAEELVLNPNTVGRAYAELIREGVLEGRQGQGVFVGGDGGRFTRKAGALRRLDGAAWRRLSTMGFISGSRPMELRECWIASCDALDAGEREAGGRHE